MYSNLETFAVLRESDFNLPHLPELPEGLVGHQNVLISPEGSGLHDQDGRPIPESHLRRGFALDLYPHGCPIPLEPATRRPESTAQRLEKIVYLPYARIAHFGHLLTEFAGNAGALFEHPQGLDGIGGKHSLLVVPARFHASVTALTNLLRLPPGRVISAAALSAPAWADEAIIIRPSMINRHGVARHHFTHVRHVLARIHRIGVGLKAFSANVGSDRVYLSRSRLSPGMRKVRAEDELASELERLGWRVVHPQELTLSRQLEILAAAHTVAGCVGSALHLLMAFGSSAAGRRLITLGEGVEQTNPNIVLQANRQGMQFRHVLCMTKDAMDGDGGLAAETFRFTAYPFSIARCIDALAREPAE